MIDQFFDPGIIGVFIAFGSVLSGTLGAVLQADEQSRAREQNARNVADTNALNYRQFQESRGGAGSAILPWYLKTPGGDLFESSVLGPELINSFSRTGGASPDTYRGLANRFASAQEGANRAVDDIFSGGTTQKMLQNFRPVAAARKAYTRDAAVSALNKTLADIEATQARRGFVGGGSGTNRLRFMAGRDAAQQEAAVALQNAIEEQGIRNRGDIELPLQSLNLPYAQAQRAIDTFNLPDNAYLDILARRLQPLSFLNIHTSAPFQYQPMPTVQPGSNPWSLALQANAGVGNTLLNNYLKNRSAQQYQQTFNDRVNAAPYGSYRDSAANQAYTDEWMNGPDYGTSAAAGGYGGASAANAAEISDWTAYAEGG